MRIAAVGVVLAALVLATAGVASAAKPIHTKVDDTYTFDDCGFEVTAHAVGVDNFSPVFDNDGNVVSFWDTSHIVTTLSANGKTIIQEVSGRHSGTASGSFSGLITFTDTYKGLPEKLKTPHGTVLTRDAGVAVFETVVDFSTNPDGDFVSQEILVVKGPHPDLDADFELFCQVVNEELG